MGPRAFRQKGMHSVELGADQKSSLEPRDVRRSRLIAHSSVLLLALTISVAGCSFGLDTELPDPDACPTSPGSQSVACGVSDLGTTDTGVGTPDVGDDADLSEFTNACGGTQRLNPPPGEECGPCGGGVQFCVSENTVECYYPALVNKCGGCAPLRDDVDAGDRCGPCNTFFETCRVTAATEDEPADITLQCCNAQGGECGVPDTNACGTCPDLTPMDSVPGDSCETTSFLTCDGTPVLFCSDTSINICGGTEDLGENAVNDLCGRADRCEIGFLICDGGSLGCTADEELNWTCGNDDCEPLLRQAVRNSCGGCELLLGQTGESCGVCNQGNWACRGPEDVYCQSAFDGINACGGCQTLQAQPRTPCGEGAVYRCRGVDDVVCYPEETNPCGGTTALEGAPGRICGPCGNGIQICTSLRQIVCAGATHINVCGGCEPLEEGQIGGACTDMEGNLGEWDCASGDVEHLACAIP